MVESARECEGWDLETEGQVTHYTQHAKGAPDWPPTQAGSQGDGASAHKGAQQLLPERSGGDGEFI